jgi:pimeloyl-ACP methyl ester carboxylesterase
LFAAEIAPDWAPELELLGVVPAAPSSELETTSREGPANPDVRGFMWMLTVAYEATYRGLSQEDLYDAETLGTIAELVDQEACRDPVLDAARDVENAGFATNPADLPSWSERLVENSPGYEPTEIPILMLQGSADPIVPQWQTDLLFDRLCEIGSQTDYRVFEGYNHAQSLTLNVPAALEWTNARFAGEPAADTCPE